MKLGDLEFKPENASIPRGLNYIEDEQDMVITIRDANRILREKLREAQQVFFSIWSGHPGMLAGVQQTDSTHRARLVAIEEISLSIKKDEK